MAYNAGASDGNLVLLSSQTASGASILEFKSVITTKYDDYVLRMSGVQGAGGALICNLQYSTDNGATYLNAANYYRTGLYANNAGGGPYYTPTDTQAYVLAEIDTAGTQQSCGMVNFYNISSGNVIPLFIAQSFIANTNRLDFFGFQYASNIAVNAFKVYPNAGTFSGSFYLYGVQK